MQVLVLAGGFGTRLRPLTLQTPKQLLKLVDKTIIEHLLDSLKKSGMKEITIAVNSAQAKIFQKNLEGYEINWIIESPKEEEEKLGAVGAIGNAKRFLKHEATLIVGANNFAPGIDFKKIVEEHGRKNCLATLVLYKLPDKKEVGKYGVAVVDGKRITGFQEKPAVEEAKSQLISTAFYVVQPEFFKELDTYIQEKESRGEKPDNLGDLWAWIVGKGIPVGYHVLESYWSDIGGFKGYLEATRVALRLREVTFVKGKNCRLGKSRIGPDVVMGDGCAIGDGCSITNSIIFSKVKIGDNCTISGSIIDEGSSISPNTTLVDQVIEKGSFIN